MSAESARGWALLHSKLPPAALKPLPTEAYGIAGLTDVNEAYLIQRLFASDLDWQWKITAQAYLGFEDRTGRSGHTLRWYLASVTGELVIDGRSFAGSGAHDNKKLDAAYKGAATVAFKNACKLAGLTIELFKDGKAMDFIYETQDIQGAGTSGGAPHTTVRASPAPGPVDGQGVGGSAEPGSEHKADPPPAKTPQEIAAEARKHIKPASAAYDDTTAVCPYCGKAEALCPAGNPRFCAKAQDGCGAPAKGQPFQVISWGEWREKHPS